jgi:hypothetical protein
MSMLCIFIFLCSNSSLFEMSFKIMYRYLYKNREIFIFIIQIYYNVKNYKSFFILNNICKQNNTKNKFIFKYFFSFFFIVVIFNEKIVKFIVHSKI